MRFLLSAIALALFVSCSSDDRNLSYPETPGLAYAESEEDFVSTYGSLRSEIQNSDFTIHKEINFKDFAESHGKRSRDTRMILFSNPSLEAPLISQKPEMGLEFPSRVMVYEDRDRYVLVAYNNTEFLSRMYELNDMSAIQNLESSLSQIVSNSTGNMTIKNESTTFGRNAMTIPSANSFTETFNRLRNEIADSNELTLVETINHQQAASMVGIEMRQNRLLLLTTGEFEANLIDGNQLASIDLPIRILVWEDENNITQISYQNLDTMMLRHNISDAYKLDDVKNMLARMVIEAAN